MSNLRSAEEIQSFTRPDADFRRSLASFSAHWAHALRIWRDRIRQREALKALDDRLLDDVGLTREQARLEIAKPFWRR
jgi:uncharacterized protein YjiS (DUF1127 family)